MFTLYMQQRFQRPILVFLSNKSWKCLKGGRLALSQRNQFIFSLASSLLQTISLSAWLLGKLGCSFRLSNWGMQLLGSLLRWYDKFSWFPNGSINNSIVMSLYVFPSVEPQKGDKRSTKEGSRIFWRHSHSAIYRPVWAGGSENSCDMSIRG